MKLTPIEEKVLERKAKGHSINRACLNLKIHRTQLYRNFRRTLKENNLNSINELFHQWQQIHL